VLFVFSLINIKPKKKKKKKFLSRKDVLTLRKLQHQCHKRD
jgi:hypothetical protein